MTFKVLSKFQESSFGKVKKILFGEFMLRITLKDCFLEPMFLYLP